MDGGKLEMYSLQVKRTVRVDGKRAVSLQHRQCNANGTHVVNVRPTEV